MQDINDYMRTSEIVDLAREDCDIKTPKSEMSHDEIRTIMRWLGVQAPDTVQVNGELVIGKTGIEFMLFLAIAEFPEFYRRYDLGRYN